MQPLHKAGELAPPVKEAIESLLGRVLQEDESVGILGLLGEERADWTGS